MQVRDQRGYLNEVEVDGSTMTVFEKLNFLRSQPANPFGTRERHPENYDLDIKPVRYSEKLAFKVAFRETDKNWGLTPNF